MEPGLKLSYDQASLHSGPHAQQHADLPRQTQATHVILSLPPELLYDILAHLSVGDLISFTFCRWDLFYALVDYLRRRIGPTFRNLKPLAMLFNDNRWPKPWLQKIARNSIQCEQPILRDVDILRSIFDDIGRPETAMRRIIYTCVEQNLPVSHSCMYNRYPGIGSLYLHQSPHAIFDKDSMLGMSILHLSILMRSPSVFKIIHGVLQNMAESERREYISQIDWNGNTALTYAINASSAHMIDHLVCDGADINRRGCFGITPLMEASHYGSTDIMDCLIRNGADITSRDSLGHSILEHIIGSNCDTKEQLLEHICPLVSQEQLDRALKYDFENTAQHMEVLVNLGANGESAGILAGDSL